MLWIILFLTLIQFEALGKTVPSPTATIQVTHTPQAVMQSSLSFSLINSQVKDGSLLIVSAVSPQAVSALKDWTAEYEGMVSPFFPVSDTLTHYIALLAVSHHHKLGHGVIVVHDPSHPETPVSTLSLKVVSAHYKSETLKVNPSFTSPSPQELKEIEADQKEVGALYKKSISQKLWNGPFQFPIASKITSPFGTNRIFNHELKSYHSGLDLRASIGTSVQAAAAGRVVLAKWLFFTGNTVILDHGYGLFTLYAHMSELRVKAGDQVTQNAVLGLSGKTGRVKGPHLHWGAVVQGVKINPLDLISYLK